jgi:hypothetical protein
MIKIYPIQLFVAPSIYFFIGWGHDPEDENEVDFVLTRRKKLLLFDTCSSLRKYCSASAGKICLVGPITVFRLYRCREQIMLMRQDGEAIDVINLLYDILNTIAPQEFGQKSLAGLWEFAQFATFDQDLSKFFAGKDGSSPESIVAKIDRLLGFILADSILLKGQGELNQSL